MKNYNTYLNEAKVSNSQLISLFKLIEKKYLKYRDDIDLTTSDMGEDNFTFGYDNVIIEIGWYSGLDELKDEDGWVITPNTQMYYLKLKIGDKVYPTLYQNHKFLVQVRKKINQLFK